MREVVIGTEECRGGIYRYTGFVAGSLRVRRVLVLVLLAAARRARAPAR